VPVACPMARFETVCSGHSRTKQIASELQILWQGKHDKPVSQADSPTKLRTCGPDVDQLAMRTAIEAGSEAVGQLPPEP
jgi:hypothetical protein